MKFTKMHGAGNDFIIINSMEENIAPSEASQLARRLCSRRTSIGADGFMLVIPPKNGGDFGMLFYNSDGSLGEMCGNGARCICRYGVEKGLSGNFPRVETTAGLVSGERIDQINYRIRLNDASILEPHYSVNIDGQVIDCAYVELGNPGIPHAIVELKGWQDMDGDELFKLGRALRNAPEFPKGANVSFLDIQSSEEVYITTFERGVEDFTLACGTGCGSAAASLFSRNKGGRVLKLHAPGGDLKVELLGEGASITDIYLSGPTCVVCDGEAYM